MPFSAAPMLWLYGVAGSLGGATATPHSDHTPCVLQYALFIFTIYIVLIQVYAKQNAKATAWLGFTKAQLSVIALRY